MKNLLILFSLVVPTLSYASIYSCSGNGFSIEIGDNPVEMKIKGHGVNAMVQNVRVSSTFNTVVNGNVTSPAATVKMTIKDSRASNPGDRFSAGLQVSSSAGIAQYSGLVCIRGNE